MSSTLHILFVIANISKSVETCVIIYYGMFKVKIISNLKVSIRKVLLNITIRVNQDLGLVRIQTNLKFQVLLNVDI